MGKYKIYIVADFGSSNSGCAYYYESDGKERLGLLHERVNGHYGKEETYFAIRKDFLEKLKSINNEVI